MALPSGPTNGNYLVDSFTVENALLKIHMTNFNPGPGMPTDWTVEIEMSEVPTSINQNQLRSLIQTKLRQKFGMEYAPLNTLIASGTPINIT